MNQGLCGSSYDKNWTWDLSATSRRDYLDPNDYFIKEFYPACSMVEVWRELPEEIYQGVKTSYHLELIKVEKTNRCTYRAITCSTLGYMPENTNPTDALIDLLIWTKKGRFEMYFDGIKKGMTVYHIGYGDVRVIEVTSSEFVVSCGSFIMYVPFTGIRYGENEQSFFWSRPEFTPPPKPIPTIKPPLGIKPEWMMKMERIEEIEEAIERYKKANWQIPQIWTHELDELRTQNPSPKPKPKQKVEKVIEGWAYNLSGKWSFTEDGSMAFNKAKLIFEVEE